MPEILNLQGYGSLLIKGAKLTVLVGLSSMVIAILLGLVGAWGKLARSRPANIAAGAYTTIVRGVPELVLILLVYYGAPTLIQDIAALMEIDLYVDLNPLVAGMCTIGFIYGAFSTEVFRGAFLAVDKGQVEAARSVGMGRVLCFRRILLPQMWAVRPTGSGKCLDGSHQSHGPDIGHSAARADAQFGHCRAGHPVTVHLLLSGLTHLPSHHHCFPGRAKAARKLGQQRREKGLI